MKNNVIANIYSKSDIEVQNGMIFMNEDEDEDNYFMIVKTDTSSLHLVSLIDGDRWCDGKEYQGVKLSDGWFKEFTYPGYANITLSNFRKE